MDRHTIMASRLQPLTLADEVAIRTALEGGGSLTLVVRDADRARSVKDPFTLAERIAMIDAAFPHEGDRIAIVALGSCGYDDDLRNSAIAEIVASAGSDPVLVGFSQDEALAAGKAVSAPAQDARRPDAAKGLTALFEEVRSGMHTTVSPAVAEWLREFSKTEARAYLDTELETIEWVRRMYGRGPHLTADALCTYGDEILLVMRGNPPFRDLLAIPGGILDPEESPLAAATRELAEETFIASAGEQLPEETVKAMARNFEPAVYKAEDRDPRGRYVGHAFHFDLSSLPERPKVTAGDDAKAAGWHKLSDLTPEMLAFDHFAMLHDLLDIPYPNPLTTIRGQVHGDYSPP